MSTGRKPLFTDAQRKMLDRLIEEGVRDGMRQILEGAFDGRRAKKGKKKKVMAKRTKKKAKKKKAGRRKDKRGYTDRVCKKRNCDWEGNVHARTRICPGCESWNSLVSPDA